MEKETLLELIRQEQRKSEEAWSKVEVYKQMLIAIEKGKEVDFDKDYLEYSEKAKSEVNKKLEENNFWTNCPQKTKTEIIELLTGKLGEPKNELDNNCLNSIAGKIANFYDEKDYRGKAVSSLIGKVAEITLKQFSEGKRMGQTYYRIKLTNNSTLRAQKEDLTPEKWTQIEKLAILDQELVFKYRKWIIHRDICDFYQPETETIPQTRVGAGQESPDG